MLGTFSLDIFNLEVAVFDNDAEKIEAVRKEFGR